MPAAEGKNVPSKPLPAGQALSGHVAWSPPPAAAKEASLELSVRHSLVLCMEQMPQIGRSAARCTIAFNLMPLI